MTNHRSHSELKDAVGVISVIGLLLLKLCSVVVIAILCCDLAVAVDKWHTPSQLTCPDCHTVHYRELPVYAETDGPYPRLLIASTTNNVCLACHDGTDAYAPNVISPQYDSAGGYFASPDEANDNGHSLGYPEGVQVQEPPGGPDSSLFLDCASCHAPHGSDNYRNLLPNPAGSGNASDVTVTVIQTDPADGPIPGGRTPADVYVPSNLVYQIGMGDWCNDCHTSFHGANSTDTGTGHPWLRHPQDVSMGASTYVNVYHWNNTVDNHVEVESLDSLIPSGDDEVFCLSCHKAHGSSNKHSLIYADGTKRSTCLQCHYGPYDLTKHYLGDPDGIPPNTGVNRVPGEPAGDCSHCHDLHGSRDGVPTPGGPHAYALFRANDNDLCYECHTAAGVNDIYQGAGSYIGSIHETDNDVYWPGSQPPTVPPRPSSDAGKCVNCHTPHGYDDGSGLVPSQAIAREEDLCEACHDGSPAKNIKSEMSGGHRHPIQYDSRHDPSEDSPNDFSGSDRHAECVDCHNPHYADSDSVTPTAPNASDRIRGVSGVDTNYGDISPDPGINYEYELCYKCHSAWTTQPGGQPDMAELFDTGNPSYHPVETVSTNPGIDDRAFTGVWDDSYGAHHGEMYCTDCHTSDNNSVRGPHGSVNLHILKEPYTTNENGGHDISGEICFDCHNYSTYADVALKETDGTYSRFRDHSNHTDPSFAGFSCYVCHDSHGSISQPHLIILGRGLTEYTETSSGGSCSAPDTGCHEPVISLEYIITYER